MNYNYKKEYNTKYAKEHYKMKQIKMNIKKDKDIINWWEKTENASAKVKELIREDIKRTS